MTHDMLSGLHVLQALIHNYLSRAIHVILVRPRKHIHVLLDDAGITRSVGYVMHAMMQTCDATMLSCDVMLHLVRCHGCSVSGTMRHDMM